MSLSQPRPEQQHPVHPEGVEVVPRRVRFELDASVPKYWYDGSPYMTHFFNALSVLFPEGERFFIDSVRRYEQEIADPKTRKELKAFIRQEAQHGHQHQAYNDMMQAHGVDLARFDRGLKKLLGFVRRNAPHRIQIGMTICLEHFTAVLANQLLTRPDITDPMHPAVRPLWIWHAVEETEHKAVCYDAYEQTGGGYWNRALVMARVMFGFPISVFVIQSMLLARDGKLFAPRDWWRFMRFAWGRGGLLRAVWPEMKDFFRRDFHPWQMQNAELIEANLEVYGPYVVTRGAA